MEVVNIILSSAPRLKIFHLSSNGQEPGIIFALAKNVLRAGRLPVVNISLDGAQELHDELKGVPGAFQKSLEAFKLLKSLKKGRYYLSCTISDHNIGHLDDFLAFLKEAVPWVSLSDIHFNVFHKSGHYYRNSDMDGLSCPDADLFEKYILHSKKGNGVRVFFDSCYMKGLRRYIQAGSQPLGCRALKSTCFISPEGEVYPCGIFDMPLGNLRDYAFDFRRIWNSDTALIALDRIDKLHCPGCWSPCEAYPAILGNIVRSFLL